VSRERAFRRAQREADRARRLAEHQHQQQRAARRQARRRAVGEALPQRVRVARPLGRLESRRRRRWRIALLVVVVVQAATWVLSDSWWLRFGVLGLSLLFTPVVLVLAADRRS